MDQLLDSVLILVIGLNFVALGVGRLPAIITAVAIQGILLGLVPPMVHEHLGLRGFLMAGFAIVLKGLVVPSMLFHALREVNIQREVNPVVGFIPSLLLGGAGTGLALVFSSTLPLTEAHAGQLIVPVSLSTVFTGFLVLTTRQKAILQVLGYLILENGIFLFGLLLLEAMPALVEVGVLLDVFTGVFVMGIIIHHINREPASGSAEVLTELQD